MREETRLPFNFRSFLKLGGKKFRKNLKSLEFSPIFMNCNQGNVDWAD